MAAGPDTLLRYIRGLATRPEPDEGSDAALLDRFVKRRDETAFAALVVRHGPLVLHVCQRILGDRHDAEDAFQAAFLVLARKAATVRRRQALPAWLYGVARRAALKARSTKARRCREIAPPTLDPSDPHPDPLAELSAREVLLIVAEELECLPEVYRLPVILCGLESRSLEEAARQLGWTVGSVKGRLERGRARLHARLVRRGATLSAGLAAAEASRGTASAAVVARLLPGTIHSAMAFAAGVNGASDSAAGLAGQTLRRMALARLRIAAALLLAAGLLTTGLVIRWAAPSPAPATAQVRPALSTDRQLGAVQDEADVPIAIGGRVLDPDGRPLPGAKLYIGFSRHRPVLDVQDRQVNYPPRMTTAADGRFQFTFTKAELDAMQLDHSRPAVIAVREGFGPNWAVIKESAADAELSLRLVEDVPVHGRILDQNKQPVPGARVSVWEVTTCSEDTLTRVLQGQACVPTDDAWRGPPPGQFPPVTTAADGSFNMTGIGKDRIVTLVVEGSGIQRTFFYAVTRPRSAVPFATQFHLANFEYTVPVARRIRGIVRDKATGRPVAGVTMIAQGISFVSFANYHTSRTDDTGSYEILVPPQSSGWMVCAKSESGEPYFLSSATVPDKPGPEAMVVDFDLVRGIAMHGRVTDQATGKPPKAAVVEYHPLFPNPHSSNQTNNSACVVQPDGSYRLAVLPGPGVVCTAASPRDWYAAAIIDEEKLATLVKDGINEQFGHNLRSAVGPEEQGIVQVNRFNALSLINPEEGTSSLTLDLPLQRARPIKGTVVGPDGQPLSGATVVGLTAVPEDGEILLESASFTVRGLNPRGTRDVFFYHVALGLGKTVSLRGDETEPLTVQLKPCGTAVGRFLDKAGKPASGQYVAWIGKDYGLTAQAQADAEGRFRVALMPGRKYGLTLSPPHRLAREDLTVVVESGQIKDLGDLFLSD
jgi:RNA polymerase sigma factor (sigma-70 family)